MKKFGIFILIAIVLSALSGCSENENESGSNNAAKVEIRLTDSPGLYDKVNIDIQSIEINATNDENSGWQDMNLIKPGIYNLLKFRNGMDTLLAVKEIPAGKISQVRLKLGPNNTIWINGVEYKLEVPSGQQSGIKLNIHHELLADIANKLWLDFDASRSIVRTGSKKFLLKPVIRTFTETKGGAIKGYVLPTEANVSVWAILGTDSVLAYPEQNGLYFFGGLKEGSSWKIVLDADDTIGYKDAEITDVSVENCGVTNLGTTNLVK